MYPICFFYPELEQSMFLISNDVVPFFIYINLTNVTISSTMLQRGLHTVYNTKNPNIFNCSAK